MDGFEIRTIDVKKGKGLYATKNFQPGDVILEEDPLVSCQFAWNAFYGYVACDHCMRPLETPEQNVRRLACKPDIVLPHPNCYDSCLENVTSCDRCPARYCSEQCRQNALRYHPALCYDHTDAQHPVNVLLDAWKQMHYPPESASIMLLVRLLARVQLSADPSSEAAHIRTFCRRAVNEDAQLAHKLLGDQFAQQIETLQTLVARVMSPAIPQVQEFLSPDGFLSLLALVGTNGQGVGTSPLAQWARAAGDMPMSDDERTQFDTFLDTVYQHVEQEAGTFLNTEGSALYCMQSAANHSCAPNAEVSFPYSCHTLQMRAFIPIQAGDEICISYLDECALQRSRHSRQKELAENYLFVCWCERCASQADQPDVTSEEEDDDMSDDAD